MEFRRDLLQMIAPTQPEPGCLAFHVFESLAELRLFAIHSEWTDETAFECHAQLPHTVRFLKAAEQLLT